MSGLRGNERGPALSQLLPGGCRDQAGWQSLSDQSPFMFQLAQARQGGGGSRAGTAPPLSPPSPSQPQAPEAGLQPLPLQALPPGLPLGAPASICSWDLALPASPSPRAAPSAVSGWWSPEQASLWGQQPLWSPPPSCAPLSCVETRGKWNVMHGSRHG